MQVSTNTARSSDFPPNLSESKEGKYLIFTLAEEEYGIRIEKIREIIGMMPITYIPQTPEYVKGVINLRGKVIPVIDFRLRFRMNSCDYTDRTCIVVVEIPTAREALLIGLVVDGVTEVCAIKANEIDEAPSFGTGIRTDYILGMAKSEGKVKILLNIERILTEEDISLINKVA